MVLASTTPHPLSPNLFVLHGKASLWISTSKSLPKQWTTAKLHVPLQTHITPKKSNTNSQVLCTSWKVKVVDILYQVFPCYDGRLLLVQIGKGDNWQLPYCPKMGLPVIGPIIHPTLALRLQTTRKISWIANLNTSLCWSLCWR